MDITFNLNPTVAAAGADQTGAGTCGTTSTTLAANTPTVGTGSWTIVAGVGGTIVTPGSPTSVFNGVAGNTYTLRWTITNAPCPASFDEVDITFNQNPSSRVSVEPSLRKSDRSSRCRWSGRSGLTVAAAGADQTGAGTCGTTSTTLAGNTPTVGTGTWTIVAGVGGTIVTPGSPTSVFNGVAGNTYTLRWTITNAPCPASFDEVDITFNQNPTVAAAGADQTGAGTCGTTSTTLAANTPTVGTGTWTIVAGVGGTIVTPGSPTSVFNGVAGNTYTLRWTITNSPCPASFDEVDITFNQNPTVAAAGADQTGAGTCGTTSTTLAANTPTVGTGTWTIVAGVGGTVVAPGSPTSVFNGVAGNTYTLRWTITNAPCPASFDEVDITFNQNPTVAAAGADQNNCGVTTTSLTGNLPSLGTGTWTIVAGVGGTVVTPGSPTSVFNGVAGNTYTLRWTITNGPCPASFDEVNIVFSLTPPAANAGPDQIGPSTCGLTSLSLAGSAPGSGTGNWTIIAGVGGTIVTPASPTSVFNGVSGTTYTLRWTVATPPCATTFDDVNILFNENPTTANAGTDQTIACQDTAVMAGNTVAIGVGTWTVVSGTATIDNPNSPNTPIRGLVGGPVTLRWTISNSPCPDAFDEVTITRINCAPVLDNEFHVINEDNSAIGDLTNAGDFDPDGTILTANTVPVSGPANGSIVINPNGTYTYTPNPNYNGTDQVVVEICDAGTPLPAICLNDTIFITIIPVNDPPVGVPDTITIPEDTSNVTICVLGNDSDVDGDPLTITTNCGPSNGTASVVANCIVYTPNPNFNGNDTVCYIVCDPFGGCDTTIVTIIVTPVNDPPIGLPDSITIPEDTSNVTICVLGNDSDVDGDPLTITTNCGPSNGTASVVANCIVYTPNPNFNGNDTICYIVCDPFGGCDTTIVTIIVTPVNDPPVGLPDSITIPEDTSNVTICVLGNDSDVDGDPLTITTNCGPSNGTASVVANCIVYTPNPNFNGNDTICYIVCDPFGGCDTTIVTIVVTPVNDPPVGVPDSITIPEDTSNVTICVLGNDSDVDGDPLTITTNCGPSNGTASVVANCIVYTPNPNFNGNDTICYILCDPFGGCDTTIVTIIVTPVNDPPVGLPDTITIPEDTSNVTICVLGNDSDVDGDPLTITTNCGPSNGTASVVANCIVYTPNPNFNGNDTICYIVCDPFGGCDTTIVTIIVTPVNDPPVGLPDTITIPEDTSNVTICVLGNDSDVDGDPLTITTNCGPSNGTASVVANCIVYTPNPNFNGNDTICYIVCDPFGGCDTTIVTIIVTPVNDPPVGVPDTITIREDTSNVTICVLGNDSDVDGDPLTITTNCGPSNGTASVVANCIVYTPNPNFNGNDTICYIVCDPFGGCDTTIVTIIVTPVNDPPVGVPDTITIPEDTSNVTICVLGNDSDVDGDPLTITTNCGPSNGTASVVANCIVYTPNPNFNGNDTICYIVCDPFGGCDTTIVTIIVTPVNDPPVGVPDTITIPEDTSNVTICVLGNDSDVDGDPLTITTNCGPSNGTASVVANCIVYTPNPNFNGNDTICYIVCDPFGGCDTTIVTIIVTPVNDPPVGLPDSITIPEDTSNVTICVLGNDSDVDGDPLTITTNCGPSNGTASVVANCIVYTPNPNFNGNDTICYIVCDPFGGCDTTIVTIIVTPVNDPPVGLPDTITIPEDTSNVTICVLGNDSDVDGDPLTITTNCGPSNGTASVVANCIVYTPNPNFNGNDTICYILCDPFGGCDTTIVTIIVTPVNDPPVGVPDTLTIPEDTSTVTICVLGNDSDVDGDPLTITTNCGPSNGTASVVANCIVYTPNPNFNGNDTICYIVCDPFGGCDTTIVTIIVTPVNDPPVGLPDTITIPEDTSNVTICVLGNDSDVDGDPLTITTNCGPSNGTASVVANCIVYTPNPNFNGNDTICYIVCDPFGGCDTTIVTIIVTPVNDPPVGLPDSITIPEDTSNVTICVLGNDSDVDGDPLTITTNCGPSNGTASVVANCIVYTPNPNFNGNDTICYIVCDPFGGCDTTIVTIVVTPVNDPPVGLPDSITIPEDTSNVTICVLGNDSDVDGDPLTITTNCGPSNGTASVVANCIVYTPNPNFNGNDTICYIVCDPFGGCDTTIVTIIVTPVNDPPVGVPDTITIPEDTSNVTICVLGNDSDVDGDPLTITTNCGPSNGTASVVANCIVYTPNPNFNGNDTICYIVCDPFGGCDTTIVTIIVTPVNDPPVGLPDSITIPEDTSNVTICVLGNDSDVDGDPLTITTNCGPSNGTASVVANCIVYTPNPNFNGNDTICYIVCDPFGGCDTTIVTIIVTPVNDPPVGLPDSITIPEDTSNVTICVLGNDSDVDGDPLTITTNCGPSNGTASVVANCIVYTPNPNFNGNDTICYIVCDPFGGCDTTIVTIIVTPVNDPPVGVPDTITIPEDTSNVTICVLGNDSDVDGDPLTITTNCGPSNGTASVVANCIVYTPNPNFNGNDTICYIVCDPFGGCDTTIVTIIVTPVNDPPVGLPDSITIPEDTSNVTICVLGNDSDVDGDPLTITTNCGPSNGTASVVANCIVYTPNPNFNGNDTICYIVCDPFGGCDTTIVTIIVTPVNDPPVGVPDSITIPEDTSNVTICVLGNDSDVDGDPLTITTNCGPSNGTASVVANCIVYTPNPNFNGNDTICYIVCDPFGGCDTTIVTIIVTPVNDPPVGVPDTITIPEDTSNVTICVLGNDSDVDGDPLTITTNCGPSNGTASVVANCIVYTPNPNFNGNDTICYIVCDPFGGCDTTIVTIIVTPVNDPPVANPDTVTVPNDSSIVICPMGNDFDIDGDSLSITITCGPTNGTLTGAGPCFTYTPNTGYVGMDTLCYVICDPSGACDTTIVVINVTPSNQPPIAVLDTTTTPQDVPVIICPMINDSDPNGDSLSITITCGPSNGTLTGSGPCFTYTPNSGYVGADTLCYVICDPSGACDTTIVVITVTPVNHPPMVNDDYATTCVNSFAIINVLGNDVDPDGDALTTTSIWGGPSSGLSYILGNDSIIYIPDSLFVGTDTLWYWACDSGTPSECDSGMVVITVGCPVDPPVAVDDSTTTPYGVPVTVNVLGNDTVYGAVTVSPCNLAANGTAVFNVGGTVTYTPNDGFSGIDTLCYVICDGNTPQNCDTAYVFITVSPPRGLVIPNLFTPNGDGDNEVFEIPGIELYPNASLQIFNRWGNLVYNRDRYQNQWTGANNRGEELPAGTYYYILDLHEGDIVPLNGFVVIFR